MRVGANYTPRKDWFHSWLDLSPAEVERDFATLAGIGLDHLRLFPLWPLLQPSRGLVNQRAVADLVQVVDIAADHGLQVSVDVLNGHLSSFDFLPSWVVTWHQRNLFTDADVVGAQADLVQALCEALADKPNTTGICVGNEFPQFAAPRHPQTSTCTPEQADAWLGTLLGRARQAWPDGVHVHSFDDDLWFVDNHPFTPPLAGVHGDLTTVHSWVFGGVGPHFGSGHPALTAFARYLLELAAAWAPEAERGLWLQEVGAPSTHVSPEEAPGFLRDTLGQVADMPRLEAVTWWCSHDVSRSLVDYPELEYSLGLVDSEGRVKPIGHQLAEMIPDLRSSQPVSTAPPQSTERPVLEFSDDVTTRSLTRPDGELFARWLELHLAGTTPRLERRS